MCVRTEVLGDGDGQEVMHDGLEGGENEAVNDDKKEGVEDKCEHAEVHVDGDVVQDEQVVVLDGDVDDEMNDEGIVGKEDSGAEMVVVEGVGREENDNGGAKRKRNVELRTGVGDTMGEGQVPGDGALSLKPISNIVMKDKSSGIFKNRGYYKDTVNGVRNIIDILESIKEARLQDLNKERLVSFGGQSKTYDRGRGDGQVSLKECQCHCHLHLHQLHKLGELVGVRDREGEGGETHQHLHQPVEIPISLPHHQHLHLQG